MKNVLVIGSTCVDVIIRLDHLPKTEESLHPESQRFSVGGCAYNVANILQRAKVPLTFITPVGGQGVYGGYVKRQLDALNFINYIDLPEAENGCCYCFVEKSGERTFVSHHGVEYSFDAAWMKPHSAKRFDLGYVCGLEIEEKTGDALIEYLETAPVETLFYAPGPTGVRIPKEKNERLYALHPVLHLNASEAMALGEADSVAAAARNLMNKTQNTVIVTLGKPGVFWMNPMAKPLPCRACQKRLWIPSARGIPTLQRRYWGCAAGCHFQLRFRWLTAWRQRWSRLRGLRCRIPTFQRC